MTRQLRTYQDRALSVMGRSSALLDAADPDIQVLGQCRWEVARILRAYQIHKHCYVFDPIIAADADPARVRLARRLKTDCIAMGERFREHLLRWSATSVADVWSDYRPATLAMIAALRAHIDRERAGIAALMQDGAASRPHAAASPRAPTLRF